MKNLKGQIITMIAAVVGIVATAFAMSDNFISMATFQQFKEHVIYRLDTIDHKLDRLIDESQRP